MLILIWDSYDKCKYVNTRLDPYWLEKVDRVNSEKRKGVSFSPSAQHKEPELILRSHIFSSTLFFFFSSFPSRQCFKVSRRAEMCPRTIEEEEFRPSKMG